MIDPRDAQLELPEEYAETIAGASMTECARRFLQRHGLSTISETTVTEWVIKPGDPLLVLGTLSEPAVTKVTASGEGRSYLSAEAADLQRRERLEEFGVPGGIPPNQPARAATSFSLHPRVILAAGANRDPFVLSRENPQRMIARLARSSVLRHLGWPGARTVQPRTALQMAARLVDRTSTFFRQPTHNDLAVSSTKIWSILRSRSQLFEQGMCVYGIQRN